ncbi:hypothetical protein HWV62_43202 [Athelia sp. TMB]|nr:hypothetical protein HWV62_43202 [Athelia sp. TMB]
MFATSMSKLTSDSFDEFNGSLQSAALKSTKNALSLPSPADMAFHRSMDPDIAKELDAFSFRVLDVANNLLRLVETAKTGRTNSTGIGRKLEDQDDVVDSFQSIIVDAMDQLLERADMSIDSHLGRNKPPAIVVNPIEPPKQKPAAPRGRLDPALLHAANIVKPQLRFPIQPNNTDDGIPWRPLINHKYNARVPLGYVFTDSDSESLDVHQTSHPYAYEIKHLQYPAHMMAPTPAPPTAPRSFTETPFSWVDSAAEFSVMLEKLRGKTEVAIDLEHHSYRTWAGFLCLMQISTREEDFVVDLLEPSVRQLVPELNEILTDPQIVKVFHGADSDIVWLQQDFGMYVVNLFDTYHASKALEFSRHGLANLLEAYCDFTPDKRYQLADWRIRPLPKEMMEYARSDTHFLLYIYDNLRNALLDRSSAPSSSSDPEHNLMQTVLAHSAETALRTYEKDTYDFEGGGSGGWDAMAKRWNKGGLMKGGFGAPSRVYRSLHAWRDRVGREEDESRMYVLSNPHLFTLSEQPPRDMASLLGVFRNGHPPPLIRKRAAELLNVILSAVKDAQSEVDAAQEDVVMNPTDVADKAVEEQVVAINAGQNEVLEGRLWSHVPRIGATSTSALFGSTLGIPSNSKIARSFATSTSALFAKTTASIEQASSGSFQDVLNKIHRSLVIAPSAPTAKLEEVEDSAGQDLQPTVEGQVEIPFIPVAQRQQPATVIDDSIVVVGQARKKKRKRTKTDPSTDGPPVDDEMGDVEAGGSEETEAFDYSKVPNILDDVPTPIVEGRKKKKPKHQKGVARL